MTCSFVPPTLLDHIARHAEPDVAQAALATLQLDARQRQQRPRLWRPGPRAGMLAEPGLRRTISDAHNTEELPGDVVRTEGAPPSGDPATDEAYDGLGDTYRFYRAAYDRNSIDDAGEALDATVHYGRNYDNAFWNGEQMVFGDGDGKIFRRFTVSVDVIGHELTHGVTAHDAGLEYHGQSGALNESISDVFGSLVKQHTLRQTAEEADWLIGAGLFEPSVHGVALRSMKAPGTAYDDPVLGEDPQPATMSGYVETDEDDGGVHINSGIPNHAFYLVATELRGLAWERAGRVWYEALRHPDLAPDADFSAFAALTVEVAGRLFSDAVVAAVRDGWAAVEVAT